MISLSIGSIELFGFFVERTHGFRIVDMKSGFTILLARCVTV